MSVRFFIVVRADGNCRITKRRPTLNYDEIAFPITVEFPPGWARVYEEFGMTLRVPEAQVEPPRVEAPVQPAARPVRHIRRGGREL